MKKKILSVIIAGIMALSLAACGSTASNSANNKEKAKQAYECLNGAMSNYEIVAKSFVNATDFLGTLRGQNFCVTYQYNMASKDEKYDELLNNLSIDSSNKNAYVQHYEDLLIEHYKKEGLGAPDDLSYMVAVRFYYYTMPTVIYCYEQNGTIPDAESKMDEAKRLIQELSDTEYYDSLKLYYSSVQAFADFCTDTNTPVNFDSDGVYASSTAEKYNTMLEDIKKIKTELDFDLG